MTCSFLGLHLFILESRSAVFGLIPDHSLLSFIINWRLFFQAFLVFWIMASFFYGLKRLANAFSRHSLFDCNAINCRDKKTFQSYLIMHLEATPIWMLESRLASSLCGNGQSEWEHLIISHKLSAMTLKVQLLEDNSGISPCQLIYCSYWTSSCICVKGDMMPLLYKIALATSNNRCQHCRLGWCSAVVGQLGFL